MRDFARLAAGEVGGDAAVDRLFRLSASDSHRREMILYALDRTGSERAANAIIDALPSLQDNYVSTTDAIALPQPEPGPW
jgi:hypothetical protein